MRIGFWPPVFLCNWMGYTVGFLMRVAEDLLGMDLGFVEKDLLMIQRYFVNFLEICHRPFLIQFVIFPIQYIHMPLSG